MNRSRVAQRFVIGAYASKRLKPGKRAVVEATLDEPGAYPYRCAPRRGAVRRGTFNVQHAVLIETDMAADDVMAILYLLMRPDVNVRAIAVDGTGEVHCPTGATNALSLIALAGKPSIPVGCGRSLPLQGRHAFPAPWRQRVDGFFGLPLPATPAGSPAGSAEEVLRAAIEAAPGRVEVLTLGPPTEIAAALSSSPTVGSRLRSITMMGGAVDVPGNLAAGGIANPYAEWNVYVDPHAVNVVFRSGVPVTLVPLDATRFVPMNMAVAGRLGQSATAAFVRRLIEWILPTGSYDFWDPLAATVLVDPAVASYAQKRLVVIEDEGAESGRMIERQSGPPVRTAISVDRSRFENTFVETLR